MSSQGLSCWVRLSLKNRLPAGVPVGEYLYSVKAEWDEKARAVRQATDEQVERDASSSFVNHRSEQLVDRLKRERFRAIFDYLRRGERSNIANLVELVGVRQRHWLQGWLLLSARQNAVAEGAAAEAARRRLLLGFFELDHCTSLLQDEEFMNTIDPEVRADIEYAARILSKTLGRRAAVETDALQDSAASQPAGASPHAAASNRLAAVCAQSIAGEVDMPGFVVLMEEVLERSRGISRGYLLPMPTAERRNHEEPSFRPEIDPNSQARPAVGPGGVACRGLRWGGVAEGLARVPQAVLPPCVAIFSSADLLLCRMP